MATEKNDAKDFEQTNDYTKLPFEERVNYETKSIRKLLKGKTPLNMLLNCQNYSENKELFANLNSGKTLNRMTLKDFVLYVTALRTTTGQNFDSMLSTNDIFEKNLKIASYATPVYDKNGKAYYDLAYVENVDEEFKVFGNEKLTFEYSKLCDKEVKDSLDKGLDNNRVVDICNKLSKITGINLKLAKDIEDTNFVASKFTSLKHNIKMNLRGGAFNSLGGDYYVNDEKFNGTEILSKYIYRCAMMALDTNFDNFKEYILSDELFTNLDDDAKENYITMFENQYKSSNVQRYMHSICADLVSSEIVKTIEGLSPQERLTLSQAYLLSATQKINGMGSFATNWAYSKFVSKNVIDAVEKYYENANFKAQDIVKFNESLSFKPLFESYDKNQAIFGEYKLPYVEGFNYSSTIDEKTKTKEKSEDSYKLMSRIKKNPKKENTPKENPTTPEDKKGEAHYVFDHSTGSWVKMDEQEEKEESFAQKIDKRLKRSQPEKKEEDTSSTNEAEEIPFTPVGRYVNPAFASVFANLDIEDGKEEIKVILQDLVKYNDFLKNYNNLDKQSKEVKDEILYNYLGINAHLSKLDDVEEKIENIEKFIDLNKEFVADNLSNLTVELENLIQNTVKTKDFLNKTRSIYKGIIESKKEKIAQPEEFYLTQAIKAHFKAVEDALWTQTTPTSANTSFGLMEKEPEDKTSNENSNPENPTEIVEDPDTKPVEEKTEDLNEVQEVVDAVIAHFESVDKAIKEQEVVDAVVKYFDMVNKEIEEQKIVDAIKYHFNSVDKSIEEQKMTDALTGHFNMVDKQIYQQPVMLPEFETIDLDENEQKQNKQIQSSLDQFITGGVAVVKNEDNGLKSTKIIKEFSESKGTFGHKSTAQIRADVEKYLVKYTAKALSEKSLQDKKAVGKVDVKNKFALNKAQRIAGVQTSIESIFNNSMGKDKQASETANNVILKAIHSKDEIEKVEGETVNNLRLLIANESNKIIETYTRMVEDKNLSEADAELLERWQNCRTTASFINHYANVIARQVEVAKEINNEKNSVAESVINDDDLMASKKIKYGIALKNKVKQITRIASGKVSIIEHIREKGSQYFALGDGRFVQRFESGDKHSTKCFKIFESVAKGTNDAHITEKKIYSEQNLYYEQNLIEAMQIIFDRKNIDHAVALGGYVGSIVSKDVNEQNVVLDLSRQEKFEKDIKKE